MTSKTSKGGYFAQSGLKEVALLRKHFHIAGLGDNVRVAGDITPASIRQFFREYFASVRPPKLGDDKLLPKPENTVLRAWYIGDADANILLNLVVRHCLYVDQVVMVDPYLTLPHEDVLDRPQVWAQTLVNRALCLCALEDWIREGFLVLVPSLFHYFPDLDRLALSAPDGLMPRLTKSQRREFELRFTVSLLVNEPPERRASALDAMARMGRQFAVGERDDLLRRAEEYEAKYPVRFRLPSGFFDKHFEAANEVSQVYGFNLSMPLMLAPVVAELSGAFLLFEHKLLYDVLDANQAPSTPRPDAYQQLAVGFQQLEFPFLHNVSLQEALKLRQRGYLHSFRVYLKDVWTAAAEMEQNTSLDDRIAEFADRLKAEYELLEREWNDIRHELRIKAVTSGLVVGLTAVSAIALGNVNWTVGTVTGAGVGLLKEQISGYAGTSEKLREVHKKPLAVFFMLKDS